MSSETDASATASGTSSLAAGIPAAAAAPLIPPTPAIDALVQDAAAAAIVAPIAPGQLFDRLFDLVVGVEGGFVDDPNDAGGATKFGVTRATLAAWLNRPATKEEVRALTLETAKEIFHDRFWRPIAGNSLPPTVAAFIFDMAVNSGPATAGKLLQDAIKSIQKMELKTDGAIGPKTITAIGQVDELSLLAEIQARRSTFYARLKSFEFFGLGWNRRLARVAIFAGRLLLARAGVIA